jgi:hypothetical protein
VVTDDELRTLRAAGLTATIARTATPCDTGCGALTITRRFMPDLVTTGPGAGRSPMLLDAVPAAEDDVTAQYAVDRLSGWCRSITQAAPFDERDETRHHHHNYTCTAAREAVAAVSGRDYAAGDTEEN